MDKKITIAALEHLAEDYVTFLRLLKDVPFVKLIEMVCTIDGTIGLVFEEEFDDGTTEEIVFNFEDVPDIHGEETACKYVGYRYEKWKMSEATYACLEGASLKADLVKFSHLTSGVDCQLLNERAARAVFEAVDFYEKTDQTKETVTFLFESFNDTQDEPIENHYKEYSQVLQRLVDRFDVCYD